MSGSTEASGWPYPEREPSAQPVSLSVGQMRRLAQMVAEELVTRGLPLQLLVDQVVEEMLKRGLVLAPGAVPAQRSAPDARTLPVQAAAPVNGATGTAAGSAEERRSRAKRDWKPEFERPELTAHIDRLVALAAELISRNVGRPKRPGPTWRANAHAVLAGNRDGLGARDPQEVFTALNWALTQHNGFHARTTTKGFPTPEKFDAIWADWKASGRSRSVLTDAVQGASSASLHGDGPTNAADLGV